MPRIARQCPGGYIYHVWNHAAGRLRLFKKDEDYLAFERVLIEAHARHPIPLPDWCLMPNHWHFVVFPIHRTGAALKDERLDAMMAEGGIADCSKAGNCVVVCPKNIPNLESIATVGRQTALAVIRRFFNE